MTDDMTPDAEEVAAFINVNITEALGALGQAAHFAERNDATAQAAIAQGHATLAVAAQLGRIADWLSGVQLVDPMSVLGDEEPSEQEGDEVGVCSSCGHPITRRAGTTFWGHDDARRNKSVGGGHDAAPIPESVTK